MNDEELENSTIEISELPTAYYCVSCNKFYEKFRGFEELMLNDPTKEEGKDYIIHHTICPDCNNQENRERQEIGW